MLVGAAPTGLSPKNGGFVRIRIDRRQPIPPRIPPDLCGWNVAAAAGLDGRPDSVADRRPIRVLNLSWNE